MLVGHSRMKTDILPIEYLVSVFVNPEKVKRSTESKAAGITCEIIHISSDMFVTMHFSSLLTTAAQVLRSLFLEVSEGVGIGE
jgi:hypothetical protein